MSSEAARSLSVIMASQPDPQKLGELGERLRELEGKLMDWMDGASNAGASAEVMRRVSDAIAKLKKARDSLTGSRE